MTAARVAAGALRLDRIQLDGETAYWVESRASEGGRYVVVRRNVDGSIHDVTPAPFNVRSRANEYGGAAYCVDRGTIFFSNFSDQRIYRQDGTAPPRGLTESGYNFADYRFDRIRNRLLAVREDHTRAGVEPANSIASIDVDSGAVRVLVEGADFYSDPLVSPDATTLAWLQWNHPNMPWDGTELWTAKLNADGSAGERNKIAGGSRESTFQPEWSPDGTLYFASDRTGWWNLYRQRGSGVEAVHPMAAEFGRPQWTFGMVTYAFVSARQVAATFAENGSWKLALIDTQSLEFSQVPLSLQPIESIVANDKTLFFIGGSAVDPPAIVRLPLETLQPEIIRSSSGDRLTREWISAPDAITFKTRSAPVRDVHAFYYKPANPEFTAPVGTNPPLLVLSHGGPTAATSDVLDVGIQYWTSRGFAVLDVNYSGSTGYGRPYRDRLKGQWGIVDVEDVVAGANAMVEANKAEASMLAIRGRSAGGLTTLAALTFHQTFKAGASYYGISDIEVLARDTHKFEARYLDSLIGPYPEAKDLYVARSPIHFTDRLSCPIILFQGLDDKVVPPNQSAMMAEAARKKGLRVEYVTFEGEQHGFRKAETIIRALESELAFYREVFGMEGSDPSESGSPFE